MIPVEDVPSAEDIVVDVPPPTKKENSIRKYTMERQRKLITVILKLARNGSYDEEGSLRRTDGSRLDGVDFITLLHYAMSAGKSIRGLNDFVSILIQAGVTPDDIINNNVKELMIQLMAGGPARSMPIITTQDPAQPPAPPPAPPFVSDHSYAYQPQVQSADVETPAPQPSFPVDLPPTLYGPYPAGPTVYPKKKRGRPRKHFPPPPPLAGPFVPNVPTKRKETMDREEEKRPRTDNLQEDMIQANWDHDSDHDL